MPVNVPNKGLLDVRIGQVTANLRDAMRDVDDLYTELTQIGSDQLVQIGYTSEDVQALAAALGAISQLALAYEGGNYAGPSLPFDFRTATAAWWG